MTVQTEQVGEELRLLLVAAIAAVEPMLGQLNPPDGPESSCTWCPVCALAALSRGEQHPLLAAISVHGVALLAMLQEYLAKAMAGHAAQGGADPESAADAETEREADAEAEPPRPAPRRPAFQRIDVNLTGAGEADANGSASHGPEN